MRASGATILVVSHNLNVVRNLCRRSLLLHDGAPIFIGDTDEAMSHSTPCSTTTRRPSDEGAAVKDVRVELLARGTVSGPPRPSWIDGHLADHGDGSAGDRVPDVRNLVRRGGASMYTDSNFTDPARARAEAGQRLQCDVRLEARLPTGSYSAVGALVWGTTSNDRRPSPPLDFYVSGRPLVEGLADLEATFSVAP